VAPTAPLSGQVALVTGGGSGIGLASAKRLAADGASVTICGRSEERLASAASGFDGDVRTITADISDEESIRGAIEFAAEPTGSLHIVVANAGGAASAGPIVTLDKDAFENDMKLNATGTFLTIKHSAPLIARSGGGSIVAISSIAGHMTHRNLMPYSAAKAAIEMIVRTAADELGKYGVRVNAVRPGIVPTETADPLVSHAPTQADYIAQMPLGRLGTVEDIAEAVRYLAGPESSWVTGQCLNVDGGHSLRRGPDLDGLIGDLFGEMLESMMNPSS
jgi:NAD(P)-dependent dehydrogenase (short-subunit alcohol dehydrogenase family)